jgi:serine/threonine-protein kinase
MQLPIRFGKYELVEYLGGGMSQVFRARDTVLNRVVAVKVLSDRANADPDSRARFLEEARTACRLSHENIINVYDFGEEQKRPFMVMEFLTGESLREAIKHNRTGDLRNRLNTAVQIGRALAFIHAQKIIHRDIKPENLYIAPGGRVKLMDFGIAKAEGASLTRSGFILGTPYYMAPEQVTGKPLTPLVDLYAFGVLLFELLTGQKPVSGSTVEQIFQQILSAPLPSNLLREASVPPLVISLVERCTVKSPTERMQSFDQVVAELERFLDRIDASTPRPVPAPRSPGSDLPPWVAQMPPWLQSPGRLGFAALVFSFGLMMLLFFFLRALISLV